MIEVYPPAGIMGDDERMIHEMPMMMSVIVKDTIKSTVLYVLKHKAAGDAVLSHGDSRRSTTTLYAL